MSMQAVAKPRRFGPLSLYAWSVVVGVVGALGAVVFRGLIALSVLFPSSGFSELPVSCAAGRCASVCSALRALRTSACARVPIRPEHASPTAGGPMPTG